MVEKLFEIQMSYLKELYDHLPEDLEQSLPATREKDIFSLRAFGEPCGISPQGITLSGKTLTGPKGVLIALYARHARSEPVQLKPLKSFKQIKGSMPYQGAFTVHSEKSLVPYVDRVPDFRGKIFTAFDGHENEDGKGDFSFTLYPLPKVPLYYNCYRADEEFPASVTCLFASNAEWFMPVDGLADVAEYTAKKVIEIATS